MALGDLLDNPDDMEWRATLFSSLSGDIVIEPKEGVKGLGMDPIPYSVAETAYGPVGGYKVPPRKIIANLIVTTDTARRNLLEVMDPALGIAPLALRGHGYGMDVISYAVPVAAPWTTTREEVLQDERVIPAEWLAPDRRIFTLTETTTLIDSTADTIPNVGSHPAPMRVVIVGPCNGPRIRAMWHEDDPVWDFSSLNLPSGFTLTVDARTRTAVASDGAGTDVHVSHQGKSDDGKPSRWKWLHVPQGGGTFSFASDSGATEATVYSRGCFL